MMTTTTQSRAVADYLARREAIDLGDHDHIRATDGRTALTADWLPRPSDCTREPLLPAEECPTDWQTCRAMLAPLPNRVQRYCGWLAACMVLHIFEDAHPDDTRPRAALELRARWLRGEPISRARLWRVAAASAADAASAVADASAAVATADRRDFYRRWWTLCTRQLAINWTRVGRRRVEWPHATVPAKGER